MTSQVDSYKRYRTRSRVTSQEMNLLMLRDVTLPNGNFNVVAFGLGCYMTSRTHPLDVNNMPREWCRWSNEFIQHEELAYSTSVPIYITQLMYIMISTLIYYIIKLVYIEP